MKENIPNVVKKIHIQEAQRIPINWTQRGTHQGASSLSYPRLKTKREPSKQQEERKELPIKEFPQDYQLISPKKPCRQEGAGKKYSKL